MLKDTDMEYMRNQFRLMEQVIIAHNMNVQRIITDTMKNANEQPLVKSFFDIYKIVNDTNNTIVSSFTKLQETVAKETIDTIKQFQRSVKGR